MAGQGNRTRRPLNETNNDVGNFFSWLMNSSKTGVGTPQARDLGSPRYQGPGGNPNGSGQDQAKQTPGIGPFQGTGTPDVPRPAQPTGTPPMGGGNGRNEQTVNALGVPQTGTNMSRSFNDLLGGVGGGQFSSNQLPTTGDNPFEGKAPETQAFNTGAESYTGNSLTDFGGDGSAAFAQSRERTGNDTFNPSAARVEGGSDRAKAGSLDAALADKDGINSYMSKFSDGDRQRAANRAFLDTEGSMAGLRAKEAANGVVYAGGQHFVAGENADSAAVAIDRSDARNISNAKAKAQDFLTKKTADTVASTSQSPTLLEEGAANGAFQQDKPMFSGDTPAIGGAVEFDNNNSQTLPTFGAPKGFKSQSTYKDPSFPNPIR